MTQDKLHKGKRLCFVAFGHSMGVVGQGIHTTVLDVQMLCAIRSHPARTEVRDRLHVRVRHPVGIPITALRGNYRILLKGHRANMGRRITDMVVCLRWALCAFKVPQAYRTDDNALYVPAVDIHL